MSIKKKIQQSMTVILTVTLVLAYVILSVILYNRNMNLLQTEVKQEAAYIREAINLSDSDYMKQMDNVVESTRVTQIKADGTVLYDSRRDADILKNHGNRKEVRERRRGRRKKVRNGREGYVLLCSSSQRRNGAARIQVD